MDGNITDPRLFYCGLDGKWEGKESVISKKPVKGANHRPTSPLRLSVKD